MPSRDAVSTPTEADLIYLAGIFDGEGCIHNWRDGRYGRNPMRNSGVGMTVKMSHYKTIKDFADFFGSRVKTRKTAATNKFMWEWELRKRGQVHVALTQLLPYLKIKQPQAEAALLFLEATGEPLWHRELSDLEVKIRDMVYTKIKQCNAGLWDNLEVKGHETKGTQRNA